MLVSLLTAAHLYQLTNLLGDDNKQKVVLLGLRRLLDKHSGANLARCLIKALTPYTISDRIGIIVTDNASNNDTMMRALVEMLPPGTISEQQHGFCLGHIINLIVQAMLFGKGLSRFQKDLAGVSDGEVFRLWRAFGVLGKVHNIVKYIMRSDQRRQQLAKWYRGRKKSNISEDRLFEHCLMLIQDGGGKLTSMHLRAS